MAAVNNDDDDDNDGDADGPMHILDLNDDCLLEIFKYLNIHETFTLFGCICKRIDQVIYARIALLKHLTINLRDPPPFTSEQLAIIGQNLKTLYISAGYSLAAPLIMKYLQPICYRQTLQFLTLHYVHFDETCQACILKVATQLQFLDLSYCQLTDELLSPILQMCHKLRTLTIFGNYNLRCESLSALKSKELKELKVEQNSNCKNAIQKFIENHPKVTVTIFAIGYLGHINSRIYQQ